MKREDLPAGAFERLVAETGRTPAEVDELLVFVIILPGNIGAQLAQLAQVMLRQMLAEPCETVPISGPPLVIDVCVTPPANEPLWNDCSNAIRDISLEPITLVMRPAPPIPDWCAAGPEVPFWKRIQRRHPHGR